MDIIEDTDPAFPRDHVLLRQRTEMISTPSPRSDAPEHGPEASAETPRREVRGTPVPRVPSRSARPAAASAAPSVVGIRQGRAACAGLGVVALAVGVLTALLAPFTAVAWTVPVFCLVLGLGVLASLRYMAVQEQAQRAGRAERASGTPAAAHQDQAPEPSIRALEVSRSSAPASSTTAVSDAASEEPVAEAPVASAAPSEQDAAAPAKGPRSTSEASSSASVEAKSGFRGVAQAGAETSPEEDDFAGLDVAALSQTPEMQVPESVPDVAPHSAGSARPVQNGIDVEALREQARRMSAQKPVAFTPKTSSWSPVEVPRPTYADAPKAPRRAPEPLARPEAPRSSSKTVFEAAAHGEAVNLDEVLTRRRQA